MGFEKTKRPRFGLSAKCSVKPQREYWIDYARGLAALAVAVFHFNEIRPVDFGHYSAIVQKGWLGVPIFFFLSGYCIHISANNSNSSLGFLARRLVGIYLPYWMSLIIVCCAIIVSLMTAGVNDVAQVPRSFGGITVTLAALTGAPFGVKGMNWAYWTLAFELAFYFVVFVAMIKVDFYRPVLLGAAVLATFPSADHTIFFLSGFDLFALGLAVAIGTDQRQLPFAITLLVVSVLGIILTEPKSVQIVASALVLFGLIRWYLGSILIRDRIKPLRYLGDWSYSLYLIHVPIGVSLVFKYGGGAERESLVGVVSMDILALVVCCSVAAILAAWIEKPSIRLGYRLSLWIEAQRELRSKVLTLKTKN